MKKIFLTVAILALQAPVTASAPAAKPTAQAVAKSLNTLLTDVQSLNKKTNPFWDEKGTEGIVEPILQKAKAIAEKGNLPEAFAAIDSIDGALKKIGITESKLGFEVAGKQYNHRLADMLKRVKQGLVPYSAEININE